MHTYNLWPVMKGIFVSKQKFIAQDVFLSRNLGNAFMILETGNTHEKCKQRKERLLLQMCFFIRINLTICCRRGKPNEEHI